MKAQILQENFLKLLTRAGRIISQKSQLPVLQNFLLVAKEGELIITASSLETSERGAAKAKIEKSGQVCVLAKVLVEFVSSLPPDTMSLVEKEGGLEVICGGFSAVLPTTPAGEFPEIQIDQKTPSTQLEKEMFVKSLELVLFSVASDDARPLLTGLKLRKKGKELVLAATDGYRLSVKTLTTGASEDFDLVVPARALSEVVKISHEEKSLSSIGLAQAMEGQLLVRLGDTQLVTRLVEGEYPNFERIIPKTHTTRIKLEAAEVLRAVKSAAIFARDNANIVRLQIGKDEVVISAATAAAGEGKMAVGGEISGDGGEIAFNCRFLLELLANFPAKDLVFEMTGTLNPGVFKIPDDDSYLHVIMPVRVGG